MKWTLIAAGLAALAVGGLLLWQRYGLAVVLADGGWFCFGG